MSNTDPPAWLPPATSTSLAMDRRPRPNWPFLVYQQDGKFWLNLAPPASAYEHAAEAGEALF